LARGSGLRTLPPFEGAERARCGGGLNTCDGIGGLSGRDGHGFARALGPALRAFVVFGLTLPELGKLPLTFRLRFEVRFGHTLALQIKTKGRAAFRPPGPDYSA